MSWSTPSIYAKMPTPDISDVGIEPFMLLVLFNFNCPVARNFLHNLFLRQLDFQHAVLHLCCNLLSIDRLRKRKTLTE